MPGPVNVFGRFVQIMQEKAENAASDLQKIAEQQKENLNAKSKLRDMKETFEDLVSNGKETSRWMNLQAKVSRSDLEKKIQIKKKTE